ncbi:MAG TPA: ABC transporter permease [Candidatus Acidoferrum sp.]|jgi:putative ABC transport system permease protein|nr:ABC transporter permease [Candidatus Acidoferrum sp.]
MKFPLPWRRQNQLLDEEVQSHLEMAAQEHVERGEEKKEAEHAALLEFGNVELVKEVTRGMWGWKWMEDFLEDARYGLRRMRKSPGFTAIAVLTLGLGIGANTAIFSLVNGIMLNSLPYPSPEQLVSITGTYPQGAFVAMREQMRTLEVGAYAEGHEFNLTGLGEPARLTGTLVSAELFSILEARPDLGRTFYPGEDIPGQDNRVILSHALWQQRFGSDVTILGRSIELEGVSRRVVGVMPADFRFPSTKTQVWIPLHSDPRNVFSFWAGDFMPVIGRLRPDSTIQQARTEIRMFQSHVRALFPWPMPASWNADASVVELQDGIVANVRTRLLILLGAVVLVLMIACANVANLTLSRAATREKEVAIRSAMGAGRQRVIRQLLTESVLVASLGGLLGLIFATKGLVLLKILLPAETPRLADVQMDWRVLAFTGGLAILTGFVFGLGPALHSSRVALTEALKSGGRGGALSVSQRLRSALAIAEIAFAVLLVIAAGLLTRSFWALSHVNPGFHAEHVLTARISPDEAFCNDPARCVTFYRNVLDQIRSSPGVSGAAFVNTLPLGGRVSKRSLDVEGYVVPPGEDSPLFWLDVVTPDYFRVMGISFLSGRAFTDSDVSGAPVAVIAAETARRYWPSQNAVGKHIRLLGDKEWRTVIGVIPDVRAYDMQRTEPEWIGGTAYVPYSTTATLEDRRVPAEMTLAIRTAADDSQIATMLRSAVASLNREAPVSEVKTMNTVVSEAASTPRSTTLLFVAFAGLALTLAIIGVYGVLSFLVSNRTREIGIRIALGAQRRNVMFLVMKAGVQFSFAGTALGIVSALVLMRVLSGELYDVSATDPITFCSVAILVAAVALVACYVPARRAMRVDPMVALRYD